MAAAAATIAAAGLTAPSLAPAADPATDGAIEAPFAEPTIKGKRTDAACITNEQGKADCKPSGATVNVLPNGKVLYWNALEGTENVKSTIVPDFGRVAPNDQSRVLDPRTKTFTAPAQVTGGANLAGNANREPLVPSLVDSDRGGEGALFCSDQNFLPDGRVIVQGGTSYYNDPGLDQLPVGVLELEGLRNTRIYDPKTNNWTQAGDTAVGRWYPSLVTLGDGSQFVASGVQKLIKPVYPSRPQDSLTNVKKTETFDVARGTWSDNGRSGDKSLPLFPRLHLLPNGKVFYNANGQAFNPFGQSYDEAFWNIASTYDPKTKSWSDLGIPGLQGGVDLEGALQSGISGALAAAGQAVGDLSKTGIPGGGKNISLPGFRGSTFSLQLPLKPDASGNYTKAEFLTSGGVVNPPSPGSYITTSDSRITSIDTSGGQEKMTERPTGDLAAPRWYPTGVLLPTGEALAINGSDRDAVVAPGLEIPNQQMEMFDPRTETWSKVARTQRPRTYHNTAVLMPDGRVMIGGHAIISTLYTNNVTVAPGVTAPYDGRDPTFEMYSPPYMFRGDRPRITQAPSSLGYGGSGGEDATFEVTMAGAASDISKVVIVRNASLTHLVDGDQRSVELPVVKKEGNVLTVKAPPNGNVAPPGPYMLFANASSAKGEIPSVSKQVMVGQGCLPRSAQVTQNGIAGLKLGTTRSKVGRPAAASTAYADGFCVSDGGQVVDVFAAKQGRSQLLVTTARNHRLGSFRTGMRWAKVRRTRVGKRAKLTRKGVYRVGSGRRTRVFGVANGRISFVGVTDAKRARSAKSMRIMLRRGGIRVARASTKRKATEKKRSSRNVSTTADSAVKGS